MIDVLDDCSLVLVDRLHESLCDSALDISLDQALAADPVHEYIDENARDYTYDVGRVHYFIDCFRAGLAVGAIAVDTKWSGFVLVAPTLVDGFHRYTAALLTKQERILVSFSGPLDLLDWLVGDRSTNPLCD